MKKIERSMILAVCIFVLVFSLGTGAIIAIQYRHDELIRLGNQANAYSDAASKIIKGDSIAYYLETGEKDHYYNQVLSYMESVVEHTNVEYFYVFVPGEDHGTYVWDADNVYTEEGWELGHIEPYEAEEKQHIINALDQIENHGMDGDFSLTNGEFGYLATSYAPLYTSDGKIAALVGVDVMPEDAIIGTIFFMIQYGVFALVVTVILTAIYLFYIKKKIAKPIRTLHAATQDMIRNLDREETMQINVRTNNELQELAEAFMQMHEETKRYIKKLYTVTAEKERIGAELSIAKQIQASMLPNTFPPYPERDEFDIYATMKPAKEVGGDFYDFFMVDERHLAIVVADVSGKGVPAALFMVIGKTLIKDHTTAGKELGEVFTRVNNLLCASNGEGMFITAFEGVLDLVTGEFIFVNAGHDAPYISRGGGEFLPHPVEAGFVLAALEDIPYQSGRTVLEEGDKIFLFTDGVTEAVNKEMELFGTERLKRSLDQAVHEPVEELLSFIKVDMDVFSEGTEQFDDITMLGIEFKKKMKA